MVFIFLENALNLDIFTQCPRSPLKTPGRMFPQTAERGGENYDLLYQNSIRKYGVDLEHLVIYILHL